MKFELNVAFLIFSVCVDTHHNTISSMIISICPRKMRTVEKRTQFHVLSVDQTGRAENKRPYQIENTQKNLEFNFVQKSAGYWHIPNLFAIFFSKIFFCYVFFLSLNLSFFSSLAFIWMWCVQMLFAIKW